MIKLSTKVQRISFKKKKKKKQKSKENIIQFYYFDRISFTECDNLLLYC